MRFILVVNRQEAALLVESVCLVSTATFALRALSKRVAEELGRVTGRGRISERAGLRILLGDYPELR